MKIKDIITEDLSPDDIGYEDVHQMKQEMSMITTALIKNCNDYMSQVGGIKGALFENPLYRGLKLHDYSALHLDDEPYGMLNIRKDRRPTDTPESISRIVDDWFEERTNIRFRSQSIFTIGTLRSAKSYGEAVVVLPVGNFQYCWSRNYSDMFADMEAFADVTYDEVAGETPGYIPIKQRLRAVFDDYGYLDDFMNDGDYQYNKNLLEGINSGHEVMIVADKAILISAHWLEKVAQHSGGTGWL